MTLFHVTLHTDSEWAETDIIANSHEDALRVAREIDPDELSFQPYSDPLPVNEITIVDLDSRVLVWRDAELRLRLGAEDILIAAMNLLTIAERRGPLFGWSPIMRDVLQHLHEAVETIEWRNP